MALKRILSVFLALYLCLLLIPSSVLAADTDSTATAKTTSSTTSLSAPVVSAENVASSGKVKLTWNSVKGATKYQVYRATSKSGTYSRLITTTKTSVTNTSATAGKRYYYKVRAIHSDSAASSAYSTVVSRLCDLAQPKVETSNVASSGKIKLTWKKISGASKYTVYRATSKDGKYSKLTTLTGTSFTDTTATAGKAYYYKVRAIHSDSGANSAYSKIVSRTCDLARPKVTTSLTSSGNPKLTWKEVDGAEKYRVYRANYAGEFELYKTTTKTSFTDSDTYAGEMYYYQVVAVHSNSKANSARYNASVMKTVISGDRKTIGKGSKFNLEVVGDSDGGKWSSSDTSIATVSSSGKVTGKSKGSCTIYYTLADGSKLSYKIKVVNPITLDVAYVSDASVLNDCGITFHNNTNKTVEYIEFNIKQYDYKGRRVYGIYDYFYCDWYIDPLSDLTLEYWVDDTAKTCTTYIMEVKFTDGTYWYP